MLEKNDLKVSGEAEATLLVFSLGTYQFGVDIAEIEYVFRPGEMTVVPLAREEIQGIVNMRGRIVTAIDMRKIMKLERTPDEVIDSKNIVVEHGGEPYALVVDSIVSVVNIQVADVQEAPGTIPEQWRRDVVGLYKLESQLVVILSVPRLLKFLDETDEECD